MALGLPSALSFTILKVWQSCSVGRKPPTPTQNISSNKKARLHSHSPLPNPRDTTKGGSPKHAWPICFERKVRNKARGGGLIRALCCHYTAAE
jgi:hypothetical protein